MKFEPKQDAAMSTYYRNLYMTATRDLIKARRALRGANVDLQAAYKRIRQLEGSIEK